MRPIGEVINEALAHHRAGRLDEAAQIYERLAKAALPHPATHIARLRLADIAFAQAHAPLRRDEAVPDRPIVFFYRISSMSCVKTRVGDKQRCLTNFLEVLAPQPGELVIIADNCDEPTLAMVDASLAARAIGADLRKTRLGNAGSWRYAIDAAVALDSGVAVYFVEDDFLHRAGARRALAEGLARADYVSLYDHPDKYGGGGGATNPIVEGQAKWHR